MSGYSASACAKFILGGEHSVVTRGRALALPLRNLRLGVTAISEGERGLIVNEKVRSREELGLLQELCVRVGAEFPPARIEVRSEIPIGAGLGSSAALSCAISRAYNPGLIGEVLARCALAGEEFFHRNPSGIDPYTIALEQGLIFRGQDKTWKPCSLRGAEQSDCRFLLFDSGQMHRTAEVQACVERTRNTTPLIFDELMDALAMNVERMLECFEGARLRELGTLMKDSHFRLVQLGVSNDRLNDMTESINALPGCLGAKLTGAGCGGYVLALFESPGPRAPVDWYSAFARQIPGGGDAAARLNLPKIFEWRA